MIEANNPDTAEPKRSRGRPRIAKPMTVLERVRKHRLKQQRMNDQHMKQLIEIVRSISATPND